MEPNPSQRLTLFKRSLIGKKVRYISSIGTTDGALLLDWADGWLLLEYEYSPDQKEQYAVRESGLHSIQLSGR